MERMAQGMWICKGASTQNQDSYNNSLCLKSHPIPKDFEFKHVVVFYYVKQQSLALQGYVLSTQVWVVAHVVANTLRLVVQQYVLKQSQGYWLFSNALVAIISFVCQMQ